MYGAPGGGGGGPKTRKSVFGTVTKLFGNFGYVDDEIFFLRSIVAGGQPRVGDRVFVAAVYTPDMPVKWNAERLEVQNKQHQHQHSMMLHQQQQRRPQPPPPHQQGVKRSGGQQAHYPSRSASYTVNVPNRLLALPQFSVMDLRQRFPRLYLPSDFFQVNNSWLDAFPIDQPFQLGRECAFHVFNKEVDSLEHKAEMESPEPADQDYRYSAKVMLLCSPPLDQLHSRTCALAQDTSDVRNRSQPVQKTLQFLCGVSGGKTGEPLALGGPWSPSVDGEDPEGDPQVLVNTAVRHVKRLIGLDLSGCTSWCKFTEYSYYRPAKPEKQRPAVVESVTVFLPDAWCLMPGSEEDWQVRQTAWRDRLEALLNPPPPPPPPPPPAKEAKSAEEGTATAAEEEEAEPNAQERKQEEEEEDTTELTEDSSALEDGSKTETDAAATKAQKNFF